MGEGTHCDRAPEDFLRFACNSPYKVDGVTVRPGETKEQCDKRRLAYLARVKELTAPGYKQEAHIVLEFMYYDKKNNRSWVFDNKEYFKACASYKIIC